VFEDRFSQELLAVGMRLLVGNRCTGRSRQGQYFIPAEACFLAPTCKIRTGEIERVAEFNEHIERHQQAEQVGAPLVIDEMLDRDEGSAFGQRAIGLGDKMLLPLEISVVQDHAHRDELGFGELVLEEVDIIRSNPFGHAALCNNASCNRCHDWKIIARA
jgi:hypothetical protein